MHMHTLIACYILSPTTQMYMYLYMYASPSPHMDMYDGFHSKRRSRCIPLCLQGFPDRLLSALDPDCTNHSQGYLDSSTYAWPVAVNLRCCDLTLGLSYLCFKILFILPTLVRERTLFRVTQWA